MDDRDDAACWLRELQPDEGFDDAFDHFRVWQIAPTVGYVGRSTIATDHETRGDASLQRPIPGQSVQIALATTLPSCPPARGEFRSLCRFRDGLVPSPPVPGAAEQELIELVGRTARRVSAAIEAFALHEALAVVWVLVAAGNRYVEQTAPWALGKAERCDSRDSRLDLALYAVGDLIRSVGLLLRPFLPVTATEILRRVGVKGGVRGAVRPWELLPGARVTVGPPLFPKSR